jgi:hypothetical protein
MDSHGHGGILELIAVNVSDSLQGSKRPRTVGIAPFALAYRLWAMKSRELRDVAWR